MTTPPLLRAVSLEKVFQPTRRLSDAFRSKKLPPIRAVDGLNIDLAEGEVLGLAGESGSGKTVTAELLAGLQSPSGGHVEFLGKDTATLSRDERRRFRQEVSMVFQDPFDSLNPRWRVWMTVAEPLEIHGTSRDVRRRAALEMLERVQLDPATFYADKYPHELSGGERQRVAIARALVLQPRVLIADEPTTMLDVSIRAGLLNLLKDLQQESGLALLFVSHDFSTLGYLCDRIAIMYRGVVVEQGTVEGVLDRRLHPYTLALASAIPVPDPRAHRQRSPLEDMDLAATPRGGCRFADRCPRQMDQCRSSEPALTDYDRQHAVACYLYDQVGSRSV